jgi:hypothetical protein
VLEEIRLGDTDLDFDLDIVLENPCVGACDPLPFNPMWPLFLT